ncbi:GTP 3',8-cyclase MoaA [Candidatus Micrarchaeota archaeon]|nr:GTP 3',8-cyclase MoaA [Candidatus Micrarchaeota archaeon]
MIYDRFERPITGVRISVTSRCNLRCIYCHKEGIEESCTEMTPEEISRIIKVCAKFGVTRVKITGGEPLLREDICEIVELSHVDGVNDVSMTTNGTLLEEYAEDIKSAGLNRINVSLDTLKPEVFSHITRGGKLEEVLNGVETAIEAGLKPVKLNMVVMEGINEKEIHDVLKNYSRDGVVLQLIELVNTDSEFFKKYFFDLDTVERSFEKSSDRVTVRKLMHGRRKYSVNGSVVEIVKPMHNTEFCAKCTRIRITPDGKFKPCLMRGDNLVDFLTVMRSGASDSKLEELFKEAVLLREPYFKVK